MLLTERATMSTTTAFGIYADSGIDESLPAPAILNIGLTVFVLFTSIDETLKALRRAQQIARPVGAHIVVVAAPVIPHPLQLDQPPVSFDFLIKEFEEKAGGHLDNIRIAVYLCRDQEEALKRVLNIHCPVVIGISKRWLPTREERLAKRLLRIGYDVITVS